jgi:hypothetical protein
VDRSSARATVPKRRASGRYVCGASIAGKCAPQRCPRMRKPACMTPSDPPHPKVMRGARPLRAAAEAAEACSEVAAAARCGSWRRWRRVMAVAVVVEEVWRSRRRSWRALPPAPQQRAALRSGPTCAQAIRQSARGPDARSNVGVGLRAGVHTLAVAP